ncbi:MAG: diguanylate cyclase [Treponema sp.]|nr:diguanylate cyclase [Treponema sp.]
MTYSLIAILAIVIHCIVNFDIFTIRRETKLSAKKNYRLFLYSVIVFYLFDALWGVFYELKLSTALYINTTVFFVVMGLSVLMWTGFAVHYLENNNKISTVFSMIGKILFAVQFSIVIVNFFKPVLYSVTSDCIYTPGIARYILFYIQALLFLITSIYSFVIAIKSEGTVRQRHLTISAFGFVMILAISLQILYPLMPYYSIGYMVGCCVIHTFVVEHEKAEYLREIEASLDREAKQEKQLGETKQLAYTDPLTGVKSKLAYLETEARINGRIRENELDEFAVAVFDLDGLKFVNDTLGHDAGDAYIKEACRLICNFFKHSPVFRIGGDEFVVIMEGSDYANRSNLISDFNLQVEENINLGQVVISAGYSEFKRDEENEISFVFKRADENMYKRKKFLKESKNAL